LSTQMEKSTTNNGKETSSYTQKWTLQRKNDHGYFVRVGTFNDPVSQEDVRKEFGDGYYVLRSTKPRFSTTWKSWLGEPDSKDEKQKPSSNEKDAAAIQHLQRKTRLLTYGLVATAASEIIALPLIHSRFNRIEAALSQVRAVSQILPAQGLQCPRCESQLEYMLQHACQSCGYALTWPKSHLLPPPNPDGQCLGCNGYLQAHEKFCPSCGRPRMDRAPSVLVFTGGD
jgi:hypothetical protein